MMRILLPFLFVLSALAQPMPPVPEASEPLSASISLLWDPSPDGTNQPVTYQVHTGTNSGNYFRVDDFGTNTAGTVSGLDYGVTYYFAATATGTNQLMSDFSNEINASQSEPTAVRPPGELQLAEIPVYVVTVGFGDSPSEIFTNKTVRLVIDSDRPYQFFTVLTNRIETVQGIKIP